MNNKTISIAILCLVVLIVILAVTRRKPTPQPEIPQTEKETQIKKQYEDTYYNAFRLNDTSDKLLLRTIERHRELDKTMPRQRDQKRN